MNHCLRACWLDAPLAAGPLPESAADSASIYMLDESRLQGKAERIFFPRSELELLTVLRAAAQAGAKLTLSGGRTGIVGGAVPQGGWLVSLDKMDRILGLRHDLARQRYLLRCQPGVSLETLALALEQQSFAAADWPLEDQRALTEFRRSGAWIFPPDPTERAATLGGMVACNASGARTLFYGATRNHIARLRIMLADGSLLDLRRGLYRAGAQGAFQLALPEGTVRSGQIPQYAMPQVKNAAGYFAQPGMDLLDLFIGSEGTLGIFTEIEIELMPAPQLCLGVVGFFDDESAALDFIQNARSQGRPGIKASLPSSPLALEYFDTHALDLLREQKAKIGSSAPIPDLPLNVVAVYIELATSEAALQEAAEALLMLLEACGGDADKAWTATTPEEIEQLKLFRHALPEAVNQRIAARALAYPGLVKLGTDLAVPDAALQKMLAAYHRQLTAGQFEYVLFGHIGNNHIHVNILPRDLDEYQRGKALYLELAKCALSWGGTVSAEHGIGKLKKPMLLLMYGEAGVEAMRAVKAVFDPAGRLNPGNMFD